MTSFQDIDSGGFYHCVSPAYPTTIHLIHRERLLSGKMNYKLCQASPTHTKSTNTCMASTVGCDVGERKSDWRARRNSMLSKFHRFAIVFRAEHDSREANLCEQSMEGRRISKAVQVCQKKLFEILSLSALCFSRPPQHGLFSCRL